MYFSPFCAWKVQNQGSSGSGVWYRRTFWFIGSTFLLCPHIVEGARQLSAVSFIRALMPFLRALLSWPNDLPKAPPPNTITLVIRFQHTNFLGAHKIQILILIWSDSDHCTWHLEPPMKPSSLFLTSPLGRMHGFSVLHELTVLVFFGYNTLFS